MDFKKTTRQHAERKYIQMLDGSTPPPYEGDVEIDASRTYSSKRDRYYNRLSQERSEFNSALSKVQSAESARLRSEEADLEKGAKARYKLFKMLKTIAFLLPIVLAIFTGINIFSNKTLYDQLTGAPYIFFWVLFALATLVIAVVLIRSLNQNEIYYNRNHVEGKVKYSALAIFVIAVVLAIAIVFISLTTGLISQEDDFSFVENDGRYYLTSYDGSASVLVLPDSYKGQSYAIASRAFKDRTDISTVVIPMGVTFIGEEAFDGCDIKSLTVLVKDDIDYNVSYPSSDAITIKELVVYKNAFGEDSNLNIEEINIPAELLNCLSFGSSLKKVVINGGAEIPSYEFFDCTSLESAVIPNSVTTIGFGAFGGCPALKELTIPFIGKTRNPDETRWSTFGYIFGDGDKDGNMNSSSKSYLTSSEDSEYTTQLGYIFKIPDSLKKVTITDQSSVCARAFVNCDLLEQIVYEKTLTEIGEYAFENCSKMKSMPKFELKALGKGVFKNCTSLEALALPSTLTEIGEYSFYGCTGLKSIVIPKTITQIRYGAFGKCDSLEEITLPFIGKNKQPEEVRFSTLGYIFGDSSDNNSMSSTSSQYVTSDSTEHTTQNGYAFLIPKSLKIVKVTDQQTICDYAFVNCDLLERVTYEKPANSIGAYAFSGCSSLKRMPENTASTISERAFLDCKSLEVIALDNVTSIGAYAFWGCSSLKSITVPDKVTSLSEGVFGACTELESITLPFVGASNSESSASQKTLFGYIFGTSNKSGVATRQYYKSGSSATYYIPESLKSVTITGGKLFYGAFYNCSNLKKVTLGDKIDEIGEKVFYGCSSLEELTTPYIGKTLMASEGASSTTVLGYFFGTSSFTNATEVDQNFETYYIPNSLKKVNITKGTYVEVYGNDGDSYYPTTMSKILSHTFAGCTSLESVTLPDELEMIGNYAFNGCTGLTEITIPDSVTLIGDYAFYNNSAIKSITIGDAVTSIGSSAFYNCTSLESISIPDSITSIGNQAFYGCSSLKYNEYENALYFGNDENPYVVLIKAKDGGITSCTISRDAKIIYSYAFEYCSSLTSITIPNNIISIGEYAFRNCTSLTIYCEVESKPSSWNSYWNYSNRPVVWGYGFAVVNGVMYSIKDNVATVVRQAGNIKEANIPESIEHDGVSYPVTSIENQAFYNCTALTSVTIPDSVTSIGNQAFYGCTSLTSITIPNSVTTIGYNAFNGSNIKNVTASLNVISNMPKSSLQTINITDGTTIENFAFQNCYNLTSITLPDSITSIGASAFDGCSKLKSIEIPNSVSSISYTAFYGCNSLTDITVDESNQSYKSLNGILYNKNGSSILCYPAGKTATSFAIPNSVKTIGSSAFFGCRSLTSVTIPNSVTSIESAAFNNCSGITSLIIPNSVTSIGSSAFNGCTNIKTAKIPSLAVSLLPKNSLTTVEITSGTSIGASAFSGCSKLTSVVIPNSITSIGASAFSGCSKLTSVVIPDSVISIGLGAFSGCSSLESITIPFVGGSRKTSSNTYQYPLGYIFGTNSYTGGRETLQYFYGSSTSDATSSTYYIPLSLKSVTVTGGNILYGAFYNCTSLTSITLPNSITSIGASAFSGCSKLTSVVIPDSVTSIGERAFYSCTSLASVTIGKGVTTIEDYAFTSLDEIHINDIASWCNISFNSRLGNPLYYAEKLYVNGELITDLIIPNTVTKIKPYAFYGCDFLKSVTISNSVSSIGDYAFYDCASLKSVTIEDGVISIGEYAFEYCTSLESIIIPDSVISIGHYAFGYCVALTSITIFDSVTSMGNLVFYNCDSLTIYCEVTSQPSGWGSNWNYSNRPVVWGQTGK